MTCVCVCVCVYVRVSRSHDMGVTVASFDPGNDTLVVTGRCAFVCYHQNLKNYFLQLRRRGTRLGPETLSTPLCCS